MIKNSFCLILIFLFGCRGTDLRKEIVGTWDCANLNKLRFQSKFDTNYTWIFNDNSTVVQYLTQTDGAQRARTTNTYTINGELLWFGSDTNNVLKVKLASNTLTLTYERSINSEDIGAKLIFYRCVGR